MEKILVTGASGFLGRALMSRLSIDGLSGRAVIRYASRDPYPNDIDKIFVPALEADFDWNVGLKDVKTIVHCAGRAHVTRETSSNPIDEFRKINVLGTMNLARQAVEARVRRFIFISSIGVNGSETLGQPFLADSPAAPQEPYSSSKWEAEQALTLLSLETDMEVVIIRPPLIYGFNAPGNFSKLSRAIDRKLPLPFGRICNRRSFVALDNIVDLIICCLTHPNAANQVFLISDGEDVSTTEFIQKIAKAKNRNVFLLPIPVTTLKFLAKLTRKESQLKKIVGSLQIDISKTTQLLSWRPITNMDNALHKTFQSKGLLGSINRD